MRNKYFLSIIAILLFSHSIFSQDLYMTGTLGLNRGIQRNSLDFQGVRLNYSPGSGVKFEGGVEYRSTSNFIFYGNLGLNLSYALQYYSLNGQSNKSSYNFNWKTVSGGFGKFISYEEIQLLNGFSILGGLDYSIPGKASITENNNYLGEVFYNPSIGFHFNFRAHLQIKNLEVMPSFRINAIRHSMRYYDYENGNPRADLMDPKSTGISLCLTVAKKLGGNQ